MEIKQFKHFKGVYESKIAGRTSILTKNMTPGKTVYGESTFKVDGAEYREWDPERSKLGAALLKEVSQINMKEGDYILYLGCSTGTTVSHVSDIVGPNGLIFALDFAPRVLRDMVFVSEDRKNIAPIMADANKPETYAHLVSQVDTLFMDIAQRNQTEIFIKNCDMFLKPGGFGLLALKARSVDVTRYPKDIFREVRAVLERKFTMVDYRELDPFEKDHAFYVVKKK
ncbi:MAG TPA: fibrillarin-like rRNA/tRNA 2'-O-methyltransferase [Alphaproteobacteria bacterium]|nr:fibrillarin-like rRNA/tRNA 2'-O-methyltransferase [Alphaproteobacteria bacterium]